MQRSISPAISNVRYYVLLCQYLGDIRVRRPLVSSDDDFFTKNNHVFVTFQVVHHSLKTKDDDDALIQVLIELAESTPKYLRTQIQAIFQMCIAVVIDFIEV